MVSVSNTTMNATATFRSAKPEDVAADIAKLRLQSMPLEQELQELEVKAIKTPEMQVRISELRLEIQDLRVVIEQKQSVLDSLRAETARVAQKAAGKGTADEAQRRAAETNPYVRIFKTDVSELGEAVRRVSEDPLEAMTRRGPRTTMDAETAAAALLVAREEAESPPAGEAIDAPTAAQPSTEEDGDSASEESPPSRQPADTDDRMIGEEEKEREDPLQRLREIDER